jgi:hypothetical protein
MGASARGVPIPSVSFSFSVSNFTCQDAMTAALLELTVIRIDLRSTGSFQDLVTSPADVALQAIADAVASDTPGELNLTILLIQPPAADHETDALHEAAFQAMRGIVGALTLELGGRLRLNLVRAGSVKSAEPTLHYLARADAAFVAGATLDLTGGFE